MSQQPPGGFPNVQRLQQFAGTNQYGQQYGQGPMAAPFQGGPPRPQLAGAYPPAAPPVLRAPGPPAPWMINPAATPAMAQAKANWQNGPAGGTAPISDFYQGGGRLSGATYNPTASPAAAIAKTASPFVPAAPAPVFRPVAPAAAPPTPVYTPAPPPAAMAAPQAAPVAYPPVSAPPVYTPGQAPPMAYAPFGARLSDRREKRVLSLKDILGS